MRFYVPEWDDAVDAEYDFVHDELSTLDKSQRRRHYVWDVFERGETPIDGVLISREQVEDNDAKFERLTDHGVYDDPVLSIPEWLPTISDCGAWGYKELPFPPYSNEGMLEFYESLDVDVGVTIDHLVLGSGKEEGRLYVDERAFGDGFGVADIPDSVTDNVDVMAAEWPSSWPDFVADHDPTLVDTEEPDPFTELDFVGPLESVLGDLSQDPRAVYRPNDKSFRFNLTLENAREMYELYESGDWSFRLMAAFQGWSPQSYVDAVSEILDIGYDYVGIGGVAGSRIDGVRQIVAEVGSTITAYERSQNTRVDCHVFGFAKTGAFETVGRAGMASFDSASMLRAAWTGGKNYHLEPDERYDAIRVRYPAPGISLEASIETALWAQETLAALRAYDDGSSIPDAIETRFERAQSALDALPAYLRAHRHDARYDKQRLRDVRAEFRDHFEHGRILCAAFGQDFRRDLVGYLREDDPVDPISFERYAELYVPARGELDRFPRTVTHLTDSWAEFDDSRQIFRVVEAYATTDLIDDEDLLDGYRRTLSARPWARCSCPICEAHGIDVAIFRGNNRNRRRGFHNTRRFYDEFDRNLPKRYVVVSGDSDLLRYDTVQSYLQEELPAFWQDVHDLPVVEVGVYDAAGVHEWWETTPDRVSLDPDGMAETLRRTAERYDTIYVFEPSGSSGQRRQPPAITTVESSDELRDLVLDELGYEVDFLPESSIQIGLGEF